ncbi:biosynthetic-type acetolactate synthase large subunit [Kurthia senegalensis]|uniref:biosynthetic-type acetolactate synthase large subunit n=1 Tax=Kurthia senegalensis TaxID=1033740 RepID=UPI00028970D2|nr:biosynthetic-type acetolactate synthase large subunit [Kurthia senegalensis]
MSAELELENHPSTKQPVETTRKTGAEVFIETLKEQDVDIIFGYPGGAVLPLYDALYRNPIKHILARHEQGAIHAAEGYARVTGRPGVVIATSGPGATNLVTGITDAMMDSLPLVVFTGQVATTVVGTDAFQEADIVGITQPITKHNYQIKDVQDIPRIIKEAFHIANTGRKGPVVVDFPKNIANALFDAASYKDEPINLPGYQPTIRPNFLQIKKAIELIQKAKKPIVLAGAGILAANAKLEFNQFIEKYQLPVVNTLLGLGTIENDHALFYGMAGMHGTYASNMGISEADVLINIGSRFDDRLTGNLSKFAPSAKIIHIDIDPAEIGKNVPTDVPIVSDAKEALQALLKQEFEVEDHTEWVTTLNTWREKYPYWYEVDEEGTLLPQQILQHVNDLTKGEAIVTTDVGQHQMFAAQYFSFKKDHRWVTSGGLGTMGFGFPAAIGAQFAFPDEVVVAIVGDAGFQMTLQELGLLQEFDLPVKIIMLNNACLGMVRQWQQSFYNERYSSSLMPVQPDFVKLAEAYNVKGIVIDDAKTAKQQLAEAFAYDGPVLIDCRVKQLELVTPMVAPGAGLNEMIGVEK